MKAVTTYEFSDTDIELLKEIIHNPCDGCQSICYDCPEYRKRRVAISAAIQEGMGDIVQSIEVIDEIKAEIECKIRVAQDIINKLPPEVQELYIKETYNK